MDAETIFAVVATHGPDELNAQAATGDQAAARALVAHVQPIVRRIVHARRPWRVAEEDIRQEVFMKMFVRLGQYHGDAPSEHWVVRSAVTTCLDHGRAWQRRPELRWADLAEWETEFLERVTDDHNGKRPGDALATAGGLAGALWGWSPAPVPAWKGRAA